MKPEVNADRDIVGRCKITHGSSTLADSSDMIFEDEKFNETACSNAINEFETVVEESFMNEPENPSNNNHNRSKKETR
jgi:hypothetical protein